MRSPLLTYLLLVALLAAPLAGQYAHSAASTPSANLVTNYSYIKTASTANANNASMPTQRNKARRPQAPRKNLASKQLEQLLDYLPSNVQTSYLLQDLASEEFLEAKNSQKPFIPASNMKILVAQAVLHHKGNGFWSSELTVPVSQEGRPEVKRLTLRGDGDPTLRVAGSHNSLRALARQAYNNGLREVDKVFIADQKIRASDFKKLPLELAMPTLRLFEWENLYRMRPPENATEARRRLGRSLIEQLRYAGIRVLDDQVNSAPPQQQYIPPKQYDEDGKLLLPNVVIPKDKRPETAVASVRTQRKAFEEYLAGLLRPSNNQRAEILLANLAQQSAETGTPKTAAQVLVRGLKQQQIFWKGVKVADGSGLSEDNRLSARTVIDTLRLLYDLPYLRTNPEAREPNGPKLWLSKDQNLFAWALPKAGLGGSKYERGGTMAHRLKHSGLEVYAKTGTLYGVSCLSGYLKSQRGRYLAFAIMMNGPETSPILQMRVLQDRMVQTMAKAY